MTSILIFAGSVRRGAFSKQLAAAATTAITEWGAKPTLIDLVDYDATIYNGDLEDAVGIPETVVEFRRLVASHHGLVIATPEYNGFITPLLLNLFCWASRPSPGDDFGTVAHHRQGLVATLELGGLRCELSTYPRLSHSRSRCILYLQGPDWCA